MTSLRGAEEYRELLYDMSSMLDRRLVAEVTESARAHSYILSKQIQETC